jgi:hypothetical protein
VNVYYDPDEYGLETFGEIDWSDGNYVFDLTVVWRRTADGVFLYADDSGCSCPSPFENTTVNDLNVVSGLEQFKETLQSRQQPGEDRSAAIVGLLERMHAAGAR